MKTASMIDVATRAGVSPATVSLVLAGKGRISDATRTRVMDAVDALGYTVNRSARSLRTSKTGAFGLYLPEYAGTLEFYMTLAFGSVDEADTTSNSIVLVPPHATVATIETLPVDGFIVVDVDPDDSVVKAILGGPKPVVAGEGVPDSLPAPAVSVEYPHDDALRMLLDHLWTQGARRIGALSIDIPAPWADAVNNAYDRWAAEQDMENLRLGLSVTDVFDNLDSEVDAIVARGVDALIVIPDTVTPRVVRRLTQQHDEAANELLVAAYFDGSFTTWMTPSITAVDFDTREFGRTLVRTLRDVVEGIPVAEKQIIIDLATIELIVRESTTRAVSR